MMIPGGPWNVRVDETHWVTFHVGSGEVLSRRPVGGPSKKALTVIQSLKDTFSDRDENRHLLAVASAATDDDLYSLHELGARMTKNGAYVQAVAQGEAYKRWPYRDGTCDCHGLPKWTHHLGDFFEVAPNTIHQNIRAMKLAESDTGAPMSLSYYKECLSAEEPETAIEAVARPLWEKKAPIRELRTALKGEVYENVERHGCPVTCPECGASGQWNHVVKQ